MIFFVDTTQDEAREEAMAEDIVALNPLLLTWLLPCSSFNTAALAKLREWNQPGDPQWKAERTQAAAAGNLIPWEYQSIHHNWK